MSFPGIVVDLSHVGPKTSMDVIEFAPEGERLNIVLHLEDIH